MAKMLLDNAGIKYIQIDATEQAELSKKLNVTKAPTLFVRIDDKIMKLENVSDIKRFIEKRI